MTMTKTKTKADYTNLSRERNYWFQAILLCLVVGVAYFGNIYRTNNNSDGINAVVITEPSIAATTTASLIRGGDGNGDAGQEDVSSTSVGDNSIESNTNLFVEEEEDGRYCSNDDDLYGGACPYLYGDECIFVSGCYYYPHFFSQGGVQRPPGSCHSCSGVNCGRVCDVDFDYRNCWLHRAPVCSACSKYDGKNKGPGYCNGDCTWQVDIDGVGSCGKR
mmetsp:Transcript_30899/g.35490  ORF Transcript_30899/g.35490 Transcript_30899/m.35490 type:complete len:219 (-) Transcript_30899:20-676(-)